MSQNKDWDSYFMPNTNNRVLRNKLGITNEELLDKIERQSVETRAEDVPDVSLDFAGLKQIHKHLFGDLYDWAGQPRIVTMGKGMTTFTPHELIEGKANTIFAQLKQDNFLKGLDKTIFITKAARLFGEINDLHPFREGNGRTQREFMQQVAQNAGHSLDFSYITLRRMIQVSEEFHQGNPEKMYRLIHEISSPEEVAMSQSFHNFVIQEHGVNSWNNLYIANATENRFYQGQFVGRNDTNFTFISDNQVLIGDVKHLDNAQIDKNNNIQVAILNQDDFAKVRLYRHRVESFFTGDEKQAYLDKLNNKLPDIAAGKINLPEMPQSQKEQSVKKDGLDR